MNRDLDYAYIAGLMDGEGTVTITNQLYLRASIRNTNLVVLEWVKSIMGGGIYPDNRRPKTCYSLDYSSKRAIVFLTKLYPYLRIKKLQADLAFEFNPWHCQRITEEERERRMSCYLRMRELNSNS